MVQLQQRLEVALQELANLERFAKKQQQPPPTTTPPNAERLLKEEAYLKARLLYVQQVRAAHSKIRPVWSLPRTGSCSRHGCALSRMFGQELADVRGDERPDKPSLGVPETEDDAELGI